jgi:hypothetical protein
MKENTAEVYKGSFKSATSRLLKGIRMEDLPFNCAYMIQIALSTHTYELTL